MPYIRANVPSINVPNSSTKALENLISEPPKRTVGFAEGPNLKKNLIMKNTEDDDEFFGMVRGKSKSINKIKASDSSRAGHQGRVPVVEVTTKS